MGTQGPTRLALFVEYLSERLAAADIDLPGVPTLVAELRGRSYIGSSQSVRRIVTRMVYGRLQNG
jgi:hypothetical protein